MNFITHKSDSLFLVIKEILSKSGNFLDYPFNPRVFSPFFMGTLMKSFESMSAFQGLVKPTLHATFIEKALFDCKSFYSCV